MSYQIPFITREQVEEADAKTALKVFPFSNRWVTHTAQVTSISIEHGRQTDFLVIKGSNGDYGVRISAPLDVTFVPMNHNRQDNTDIISKNTERLTRILKAFGLARFDEGGAWLLPERFEECIGTAFSFSIIGAMENGQPKLLDTGQQKTYVAFKGLAPALLPVVEFDEDVA